MQKPIFLALVFTAAIVSLGYFTSTTSGKNKKLIRSTAAVPGRYIVVLDTNPASPDRNRAETEASRIALEYGAVVDNVFTTIIGGFSAEMSADNAEALSKDGRVQFVEEDAIISVNDLQANPEWGLDRIDQRDLPLNTSYSFANDASNVNVYIIDTGIRPTHVEFEGRAVAAFDALSDGRNGIDCHVHGTHVAGTIGSSTYGVAKKVKLYGVRVLPCDGFGLVSHTIMGMEWVAVNRIDPSVANMSMGLPTVSQVITTAINNLVASGVTFVASAGNNGGDACLYTPGSATAGIIVGATASDDSRPGYSNYGPCVDIFAPGSGILSLSHLSDTGTRVMSGTSMASPKVAGAAALFLAQNPTATPAAVANALGINATSGKITNIDAATANRLLFIGPVEPTLLKLSISGRVVTENGQGIRNAAISLIRADGQKKRVATNSFGYFKFAKLRAGDLYTVSVTGTNRYKFLPASRSFSLNSDALNVDFLATQAP